VTDDDDDDDVGDWDSVIGIVDERVSATVQTSLRPKQPPVP